MPFRSNQNQKSTDKAMKDIRYHLLDALKELYWEPYRHPALRHKCLDFIFVTFDKIKEPLVFKLKYRSVIPSKLGKA